MDIEIFFEFYYLQGLGWDLKILIFECCNLQGVGGSGLGGGLNEKWEISYFFGLSPSYPEDFWFGLKTSILSAFEKFLVGGGGVPEIIASA